MKSEHPITVAGLVATLFVPLDPHAVLAVLGPALTCLGWYLDRRERKLQAQLLREREALVEAALRTRQDGVQ